MQRFLPIPADGLIHMHDDLAYEEAVTIPSAFATAHYALNQVGRLEKGEKVLIHVATGGVGLAAVQMAQAIGAEIFATAGSDAKRDVLRKLGVPYSDEDVKNASEQVKGKTEIDIKTGTGKRLFKGKRKYYFKCE